MGGEAGAEGRRLWGIVAEGIEFGGLFGVWSGRRVGRASDVALRFEREVEDGKLWGGGGRSWSESVSIAVGWS